MADFIIASLVGVAISLAMGFRSRSRGFQDALERRDYGSFAGRVLVGALPFAVIIWMIMALLD